jgi:hypothetical protein
MVISDIDYETDIALTTNIMKMDEDNMRHGLEHCVNITLLIVFISSTIFGIIQMTTNNALSGIGYLGTGLFSGISLYYIKQIQLYATIQTSIDILKDENNELKTLNDRLSKTIDELELIKNDINDDLSLLKETIGIVGENSDELFRQLKAIHNKLKSENDRHSILIKSQASLQLMNIFYHFDTNNDFVLNEKEIIHAKQSILNILPELDWNDVLKKIEGNQIKLESLLELLK